MKIPCDDDDDDDDDVIIFHISFAQRVLPSVL